MQLVIDNGFKSQLWPLDKSELGNLEQSIIDDGCRESLIVWSQGNVLVDGHNRYEICRKHDIDFGISVMDFESREAVEDWIDKNQAARRNCTPEQYRIITGRIYNRRKKRHGAEAGGRGNQHLVSGQLDHLPDKTADEVASELGVSSKTVRRNGQRAEVFDAMVAIGDTEAAEAAKTVPQKVIQEVRKEPELAPEKLKHVHVSKNSGENEWYTPSLYIESARKAMGSIDLDPASSEVAQKTVKAKKYYTIETDGLSGAWKGNVWMNPPYSRELIGKFTEKLSKEYDLGKVGQAIVLVNNATDTAWFQSLAKKASAFCFCCGRISFNNAQGVPEKKPLQGQCFIYLGKYPARFCKEFSSFGVVCVSVD